MSRPNASAWFRTLAGLSLGLGLAMEPEASAAADARIASTTYLRAGPGTNYRSLDEASGGSAVEVLGCGGGWCRILLGDAAGYVAEAALQPSVAPVPAAGQASSCFGNPQSGFHGSREVRFCSPAAGTAAR